MENLKDILNEDQELEESEIESNLDIDENNTDGLFQTSGVIEGYDVIENHRKSIRRYVKETNSYTKLQKDNSKKIEGTYKAITDIVKLLAIIEANKDKALDEGIITQLKSKIFDMQGYESDFIKMHRNNQDIEGKKLNYLKLSQVENKNLLAAVKVQVEALKEENLLVSMHQELSSYDKKNGTIFAIYFLPNVKKRMLARLRGQTSSLQAITFYPQKSTTRTKSDPEFKIKQTMEKYDVCKIVAERAYKIWVSVELENPNKKFYMKRCVEMATELCRREFPNIDENGKLIIKSKEEITDETKVV